MKYGLICLLFCLINTSLRGQIPDSLRPHRQLGLRLHNGFIIPHSPELKPLTQTNPLGVELSYSRMGLSRAVWERCNCFARVGGYVNYVSFNNPAVLGRTFGGGAFFEPVVFYRPKLYATVRTTVGLTYLTRVYDPVDNPQNIFFSMPFSAWLGVSFNLHHRLTSTFDLIATASYNHISNGGTRQPNKGMNFPTLALGVAYNPTLLQLPDTRPWRGGRLAQRWTGRMVAFGSVRVLEAGDGYPEVTRLMGGLIATGGYRLNRFHALTGGLEYVGDGYVRERMRRDTVGGNHRQVALLAGYELWPGRYTFAIHLGYNLLRPDREYAEGFFQRYQLLYRFPNRLIVGVGLKADRHIAKGFDVRVGYGF